MKVLLTILFVFCLAFIGCSESEDQKDAMDENSNEEETPIEESPTEEELDESECSENSDCARGGCSGTVCMTAEAAAGVITTCEFKEEYTCYQQVDCICREGMCGWSDTEELGICIESYQAS